MIQPPKIRYRHNVIEVNLDAIQGSNFKDAEDFFYTSMCDVHRIKNKWSRIFSFFNMMGFTVGIYSTWDYLVELLEWLDLTFEDLNQYIEFSKTKKFWRVEKVNCEWYFDMRRDYGR